MKSKIAFTKKDLAVALVCLVFLLMSLGAIGSRGRELSKRAVCLSNLKQLTLAWHQYADDNDDKIVNGGPMLGPRGWGYAEPPEEGTDDYPYHKDERPWVGAVRSIRQGGNPPDDPQEQSRGIQYGTLWPYMKSLNLYRCPSSLRGEALTYSVVDGMNGYILWRCGTDAIKDEMGYWIKKRSEIVSPPPAKRIVFVDEGCAGWDSFGVHVGCEAWFDAAPSRHGGGASLSYADGHSDYYKWKGLWTLTWAKSVEYTGTLKLYNRPGDPIDTTPEDGIDGPEFKYVEATCDDYDDLYFIQRGCWGNITYTPSCPK